MREALDSARASQLAGRWDEALQGYESILVRFAGEGGSPAQIADVVRSIGIVRTERGEIELAREMFDLSLVIAELNDLTEHRASALLCKAVLDQQSGQVEAAEAGYQRAAEIGSERLAAMAEQNLGTLANIRGDYGIALERYRSALKRNLRLGDDMTSAHALNNIGMTHVARAEWDKAERCFGEARDHAMRAGNALLVGSIGLNRAELHLKRRDFQQAEEVCRESLTVFTRLASKRWIGEAYKFYGILHRESGDISQSSAAFSMALGLAEVSENCLLQAETQLEWSVIHLEDGRPRDGLRYLNGALLQFGKMRAQQEILDLQQRLERAEGLYLPAVTDWAEERFGGRESPAFRHALNVAELSTELGVTLGVRGWDLMVIRVGALLHDIGKSILIPSTSRKCERGEPRLLRTHPIAGDAILSQLDFPAEVREIVRHHHEQVDGRGYPDAVQGDEISLATRVVSVANGFETERSRSGRSPMDAVRRMCRDGRMIYDARVLDALAGRVQSRSFVTDTGSIGSAA